MADQRPPAVDGDERATLAAFLDYLRACVVVKLDGVDDDTARRPLVDSGISIYWLGLHMAAVEINQFQRIIAGRDEAQLVPEAPPDPEGDQMDAVIARYRIACEESRTILSGVEDLGALSAGVDRKTGDRRRIRWVLAHMIEETARHAGHLDILREQLDGTTGR